MRAFTLTSALLSLAALTSAQSDTVPVTGKLGNATVSTGNPVGATYIAQLPAQAYSYPGPQGNIKGYVAARASPNGVGVFFEVNFSNLPTSGGQFIYHLHAAPVPANGNCTQTLAHLDPFQRGEAPPCDPNHPETCQVGDLSGKHGNVTSDPFIRTYYDAFASTTPGTAAYFGNRSFVIHFGNKTRITCANFVLLPTSTNNGSSNGSQPTQTPIQYDPSSSASSNVISMLALLGVVGLTAFLL